jgi:hypothetical protein
VTPAGAENCYNFPLVDEAQTGSTRQKPFPAWDRLIIVTVLAVVTVAAAGCGGGSTASFPEGTYARHLPPGGVMTRGPKPRRVQGGYWRITIQGDRGWITEPNNKRFLTFSVSASGDVSGSVGTGGKLAVGTVSRCDDQKQPTNGTYQFLFYGPTLFTLTPVSDGCYDRLAILAGEWLKQGPSNQTAPSEQSSSPVLSGTYARYLPAAGVTTEGPKSHQIKGGYWRLTILRGQGWITEPTNERLMIFSARLSGGRLTVGPVAGCADQRRPAKGIYELRWNDDRHFMLEPISDSCYDRLAIMRKEWAKQGP